MWRFYTGIFATACCLAFSSISGVAEASEKVVVIESTITGSPEQPKVLYIIPWKAPEDPPSLQQWIDGKAAVSVLAPLERPVLQRQLAIYQMNNKGQHLAKKSSASVEN